MNEEYQTREFFKSKRSVSGNVEVVDGCIVKIDLRDGGGEEMDELGNLLQMRKVVERALLEYEKSDRRRV